MTQNHLVSNITEPINTMSRPELRQQRIKASFQQHTMQARNAQRIHISNTNLNAKGVESNKHSLLEPSHYSVERVQAEQTYATATCETPR